jgi:hypothetical protein
MSAYIVRVVDNFHYMDETEAYTQSEYPSWREAVEQARLIVDDSLAELYQPGMSAGSLHFQYIIFGADPYIVPEPESEKFSAWKYARQRCEVLCAAGDGNQRDK